MTIPAGTDADSITASQYIQKLFYAYRPVNQFSRRAGRDFEFLWSDSFNVARGWSPNGGMIGTDRKTLDTLGVNLTEKPRNAFNADLSAIRIVHDYFQNFPGRQAYNSNPLAVNGFILGDGAYFDQFTDKQRNHVDYYLFYPGEQGQAGGRQPSAFISGTEDTSTTNTTVTARDSIHFNSIMLQTPVVSAVTDTLGTGWAGPGKDAAVGFSHEFQHALNGGGVFAEIMSEAAQALVTRYPNSDPPRFDVPYTWPLLAFSGPSATSATDLWRWQRNYQGWQLFSAYLTRIIHEA